MKKLAKILLSIFLIVPSVLGMCFISPNLASNPPPPRGGGGGGANSLISSQTDKNDEKTATPHRALPSDYVQVEYIKSSKEQLIDTGVFATPTTEVVMYISFENEISVVDSSVGNAFFGASDSQVGETFTANFGAMSDQRYIIYNWGDVTYSKGENVANTYISSSMLGNKLLFQKRSGFASIGDSIANPDETTYEIMDKPLLLFGQFGSSGESVFTRYDMTVYFCKIFDGGKIVRDFVPCKRNVDGVAGLYDYISQEFFVSKTGVNFLAGSVVEKTNIRSFDDYYIDNDIAYTTIKDSFSGEGTLGNPYVISSTNAFLYLANKTISCINLSSAYVELKSDIILNDEKIDNNGNVSGGDGILYNWKNISAPSLTFDGNNFCIYGLYCSKTNYASLFSTEALLEVKNLNFSDVYLNATNQFAMAIGYSCTYISNCNLLGGKVFASSNYANAFVYSSRNIQNCKNYANICCEENFASGIATYVSTRVFGCENYGNVSSAKQYAGGILSASFLNKAIVENCKNYGSVSSGNYVGGIVSANYGYKNCVVIKNCKNYGNISGYLTGGIIGYSCGICTITGCENYGDVGGSSSSQHGSIIGLIYDNDVSHLVFVTINECKNFSKTIRPFVGVITNYTNLRLSNCYAEINRYNANSGLIAHVVENIHSIEISNVYINLSKNVNSSISLICELYNRYGLINVKNVFVETDNNVTPFIFMYGNGDKSLISVDGYVIKNNNGGFYYGSDFSGFYIDFKTGKIGLRALSGKGFYQGAVSEEMLINRGFSKKS